jgi:hypothetical protein
VTRPMGCPPPTPGQEILKTFWISGWTKQGQSRKQSVGSQLPFDTPDCREQSLPLTAEDLVPTLEVRESPNLFFNRVHARILSVIRCFSHVLEAFFVCIRTRTCVCACRIYRLRAFKLYQIKKESRLHHEVHNTEFHC